MRESRLAIFGGSESSEKDNKIHVTHTHLAFALLYINKIPSGAHARRASVSAAIC